MSQDPEEDITPAVPRTHGVRPRCIQTSGIFRIPVELIVEILTYFGDPHRNISFVNEVQGSGGALHPERIKWSTVIRKLTMTCWHLRNMLFPLLWKYVEWSNILRPLHASADHGFYAESAYLILNPTIGAYVQTLSADLNFRSAQEDLMTKFIDCLVLLPNLKTLEVFITSRDGLPLEGLRQKSTRFPSIRELGINERTMEFVGRCPNVEGLTIRGRLSSGGIALLGSYRKELKKLKRIAGVRGCAVKPVVQDFPDLQEICIVGETGLFDVNDTVIKTTKHLRSLKHLTIVEIYLTASFRSRGGQGTPECRRRRAQMKTDLNVWREHLIQVLKDSPSKGRKFARWKVSVKYPPYVIVGNHIVERGELEVLPEIPL